MTEPLPLSDFNSTVLSGSIPSPGIGILEMYPPEILTTIFSLIEHNEIKLEHPKLSPYYLPVKYRNIELMEKYQIKTSLPKLSVTMLPVYLEAEWFRPEALYIDEIHQLRTYPSHHLEKIKAIYIECSITEKEDYERLCKMENIRGLELVEEQDIFRNNHYLIPNTVLHLRVIHASEDMQFPSIRTLEILGGSSLKTWPQLTKLKLFNVEIKFPFELPVSLEYLEVNRLEVLSDVNLEYLINLHTARLEKVNNVKLPTTIRHLTCDNEVDFARYHHLEYVEGSGMDGNFSFPDTIRQIRLVDCKINELGNLPGLTKLEYLNIDISEVDFKLLEVEYPQGLKEMKLNDIWSACIDVKFNALPRRLEIFEFKPATELPIDFECIWPESVRRIELHHVSIKSLTRHDIKTTDGDHIEWPLKLEHLALTKMNLENISKTNIAKLNLKVFEVDQDNNMGTELSTMKFGSNSPKEPITREFYLYGDVFELSGSSFTGSTLSELILYSCEIHASSPVQLPSTLREISITNSGLISEVWSKFQFPSNLKILDLLNNDLTAFVKCPPKLEILDLLNNKLTTCGKINECAIEVALEGNKIPTEAILELSALMAQGNEIFGHRSKRRFRYGRLLRYNKIEGIGLVYTIKRGNRCHYLVVTKTGVRRIDGQE